MKPEEKARQIIDAKLVEACWVIQDRGEMNLSAGLGVAVREFKLTNGFVDYLLFVGSDPVGVIDLRCPSGVT